MLVGLFDASVKAVRAFRQAFARGYDAGSMGPRWPASAHMRAPVTEQTNQRGTLGQRGAYLKANSPHVAAAVNAWVTNLWADGPTLQYDDARIVKAWNAWWPKCDWEGLSDLGGFGQRVVECWITYGEAFIHLPTDPDDGGLRLHLIPVEQIDATKNEDLGNGHVIVSGIEMINGRRIAYWLLPTPPDHPFPQAGESRPVPASDMIHMFVPPWPGAVRGVTLLAPILTRAVEVDKLEDALNALANTLALLAVYITDPTGNATPHWGRDSKQFSVEPGGVRIVPLDSTINVVNPPQFNGVNDHARSMLRSIAAGAGLPYELVSHDLSQVNYSSARLGLMEFRRRVVALQKTLLVGQFLTPIFRRFVALEALAGRDLDLDTLADPTFIFPGWAPIDPEKETAADVEAMNARLKSRREIIASRGRDPEEVDAEITGDRNMPPPVQPALKKVVDNAA